MTSSNNRCPCWKVLLASVLTCVLFLLGYFSMPSDFRNPFQFRSKSEENEEPGIVPADLLGSVYNMSDFVNEKGVTPPFWSCTGGRCNTSSVWGPCYAPHAKRDWNEEVARIRASGRPSYHVSPITQKNSYDVSDCCRPGFLIIGAGKCGTSSLYHYITDHPRVLPANEKQIHYFKYYANRPMKWYYHHFPTATTFLASGALMTGEASPGYLPYPDVAHLVKARMPGPKIIAVGREPIDRAYSSYRYNYETPTVEAMQKGKYQYRHVKPQQPREYYDQYLFSFEDMMRAELEVLRECFAPDGSGVVGAKKQWGAKSWAKREFARREQDGLPPLIDLDGHCYGGMVNRTVIRRQWADLVAKYPEKVISSVDVHLKQALIGRSLYVFPLEWWYAQFPAKDIYFVCTEELSDLSGEPMNEVTQFLGLPSYNFSTIVGGGAYNVGGHRGYDNELSWDAIEEDTSSSNWTKDIPLSQDLQRELREFIQPYNERLFALTGRRCNW